MRGVQCTGDGNGNRYACRYELYALVADVALGDVCDSVCRNELMVPRHKLSS